VNDIHIEWLPGLLTILVVFVAMPLNWYVTLLLWRLHRAEPDVSAIQVSGILSTCVAAIVTVFALIFINNTLDNIVLDSYSTQVVTRGALLVLSIVPALYWLRWYRRKNGN